MTSERAVEPLSTAEETTLRSLTVDDWPPDREHFLDRLWATLDAARAATPEPREDGWEERVRLVANAILGSTSHLPHREAAQWLLDRLAAARGEPAPRENGRVERLERIFGDMELGLGDASHVGALVNEARRVVSPPHEGSRRNRQGPRHAARWRVFTSTSSVARIASANGSLGRDRSPWGPGMTSGRAPGVGEGELAEALHDAMCPTSHHDRPPARCSDWAKYPLIAASVSRRLAAARGEPPEPGPAIDVERLATALDSVDIDEFDTIGAFDSTGYARAIAYWYLGGEDPE